MSISSVTAAGTTQPLTIGSENPTAPNRSLNVDDFLELLVTQLTHQDPMKPMDDASFLGQMASFTSLEQVRALGKDFASFTSEQRALAANQYLGKVVTVYDNSGAEVTGPVSEIVLSEDGPTLTINGASYSLEAVTRVSSSISSAPEPAPSNTQP